MTNNTEDLEELLDMVLEDSIRPNTTSVGIHYDLHEYILITANIIGVLSDILMIYIILRNARMQSRRNIILVNFAIFDALDFPLFIELIAALLGRVLPLGLNGNDFDVCFISFSEGLFKFNCVFLMILLVSTTVARMTFITDAKFKWGLYLFTILIYVINLCVCTFVTKMLLFVKFSFMFLCLLVTVVAKEINICVKAYRKDPITEKTRIKMNLVRIFTYNYLAIVIVSYFAFIDGYFLFIYLEVTLHMIPFYMLVYLYHVDENFKSGIRRILRCCCKNKDGNDATVVFTENETGNEVNFSRI